MSETLKPCPFCGDKFVHAEIVRNGLWGVHCPNGQCPTAGNFIVTDFSEAEAVAAWNTRADFLRTGGEGLPGPRPDDLSIVRGEAGADLLEAAKDATVVMARAFERIHSMPRVSDSELADRVAKAKERLRLAVAKAEEPRERQWLHDLEHEDATLAALAERDREDKK